MSPYTYDFGAAARARLAHSITGDQELAREMADWIRRRLTQGHKDRPVVWDDLAKEGFELLRRFDA